MCLCPYSTNVNSVLDVLSASIQAELMSSHIYQHPTHIGVSNEASTKQVTRHKFKLAI